MDAMFLTPGGIILHRVQWVVGAFLLSSAMRCGNASVLHWITRLRHTDCDNRPVASVHQSRLLDRPEQGDIDSVLHFEAQRPFAGGSSLTLVVCNGDVHIRPNSDPDRLKIVAQLGAPLGPELTPKSFLQRFSFDSKSADIEWKLPERSRPLIEIYVPENTNLDLQLGKITLQVNDVRGDKVVNAGKGKVRLVVADGDVEYRSIVVDVAMGSFVDLRPGGVRRTNLARPLHTEFKGQGSSIAHLQMAMGRIEISNE
jgi:hypothetical protein